MGGRCGGPARRPPDHTHAAVCRIGDAVRASRGQPVCQRCQGPRCLARVDPGDPSRHDHRSGRPTIWRAISPDGALDGATTVAYIPESISGHSVLVALACDEIVMAPDAEIGDAGAGKDSVGADQRGVYVEVAGKRRTVPEAIALGMLDPALEVVDGRNRSEPRVPVLAR